MILAKLKYFSIYLIAKLAKLIFLKKKSSIIENSSIAIYLKAGIGDLLMLMPVLQNILHNSNYKLHLFTQKQNAEIAQRFNFIEKIVTILDKNSTLLKRIKSFIFQVKIFTNDNYHALIIPHSGSSLTAGFFVEYVNAPIKIGFSDFVFKHDFTDIIQLESHTSILQLNKKILEVLHIQNQECKLNLAFYEQDDAKSLKIKDHFSKEGINKLICVYPYTEVKYGGFNKNIEPDIFINLISSINSKIESVGFIFLGNQSARNHCNKIIGKLERKIFYEEYYGSKNIFETVSIISSANAIIGIDGGLMHFAQIVCPKVITIWNTTNYEMYGYDNDKNINAILLEDQQLMINNKIKSVSTISKIIAESIQ